MVQKVTSDALATLRKSITTLRQAQNFNTWDKGIKIRARLAFVYASDVIIKEVRDEVFEIPPGVHASVVVDPLLDCVVYDAPTDLPGCSYVRVMANKNGQPLNALAMRHSQHAGGYVEQVRLRDLPIDLHYAYYGIVEPGTLEPFSFVSPATGTAKYLLDGIDVIQEGRRAHQWWLLDSNFINTINAESQNTKWFAIFTATVFLSVDEAQCRARLVVGTGTQAAPVPVVELVWWPGETASNGDKGDNFMIGFEVTGRLSTLSFQMIYPPFTGQGLTPNGAYQLTLIPMDCVGSRGLDTESTTSGFHPVTQMTGKGI